MEVVCIVENKSPGCKYVLVFRRFRFPLETLWLFQVVYFHSYLIVLVKTFSSPIFVIFGLFSFSDKVYWVAWFAPDRHIVLKIYIIKSYRSIFFNVIGNNIIVLTQKTKMNVSDVLTSNSYYFSVSKGYTKHVGILRIHQNIFLIILYFRIRK